MLVNLPRALALMDKYGLEALVATTPVNVTYMSDYGSPTPYRYYGLQLFAVLPRDQARQPVLVVPASELAYLAARPSWIADVRSYGTFYVYDRGLPPHDEVEAAYAALRRSAPNYRSAGEALVAVLKDLGLASSRVGLDQGNVSAATAGALSSGLPGLTSVPAAGVFAEIRMKKSPEEMQRLRRAAEINERGFARVLETARVGIREEDLRRVYIESVLAEGAELGHWSCGVGPTASGLFPPVNRVLQPGDVLRLDTGCVYRNYWSDYARTAAVRPAKADLAERYAAVKRGMEAGEALLKPGTAICEVFEAIVNEVRKVIPDYQRHHCGHSQGIETYEQPMVLPRGKGSDIFLSGANELVLEEGMYVNLEVPYYETGWGGLQIEDSFFITSTGRERVTTLSRDLVLI